MVDRPSESETDLPVEAENGDDGIEVNYDRLFMDSRRLCLGRGVIVFLPVFSIPPPARYTAVLPGV